MTKNMLGVALFALIPLVAQDIVVDQKINIEKKIAEAKAIGFISGQMISGKTVKGSPYSAQAVSETTQSLADGNKIKHSSTTTVYRDSEGRERREETIGNLKGEPAKAVFISDPVEGVNYTLEPASKTARKNMHQGLVMTGSGAITARAGAPVHGEQRSEQLTMTYSTAGGMETNSVFFTTMDGGEKHNSKVENLGTQIIEGVSAQGSRTTVTIPAGQIGNELPINVVSERWVSPDLGVAVMTSHSDPRTGTTTYKLTNINRSEPARTLFEVPADYTMKSPGGEMRMMSDRPEEQQ